MNRLYVIIISLFVSVCAFSQTYTLQSNHLYQTSPRSPIEQDYPRPFSKSELFVSLGIGSYYLTIGNAADGIYKVLFYRRDEPSDLPIIFYIAKGDEIELYGRLPTTGYGRMLYKVADISHKQIVLKAIGPTVML